MTDSPSKENNSKSDLESNNAIFEKLDLLLKEIVELRSESQSMANSIESTHGKIDDLKQIVQAQKGEIDKCKDDLDCIKSENNYLKKEVSTLKQELCALQQYTRSNTVDIQGVPELPSENMMEVVGKVARAVRFNFKEDMVDVAHRLSGGNNTDKPRGIIVKFVRRCDSEEFLRLGRVKRGFVATDLGFVSDCKVFINPSLSKENRILLALARGVVRDGHYKYAWFQRGKVFVRKGDGKPAIQVMSREHLTSLTKPPQRQHGSEGDDGIPSASAAVGVTERRRHKKHR